MLDGAPGMLEIGPGGSDHLLLRAHLPYWEGVIHVVARAARLVGVDIDPVTARTALSEDAVLGPVVRRRPGVRAPGVWTSFEAAVAVTFPDLAGDLARTYGVLVPGLGYGLTHVFPSAELLAETSEPVAELAKSMAAGEEPRGVDAAAEQHIALRLGARDAFPATDPTVRRTVKALGADPQRWRPWRSLATVHLLLRG